MRNLLVEDDELTAKALMRVLSNEKYAVEVATDGQVLQQRVAQIRVRSVVGLDDS